MKELKMILLTLLLSGCGRTRATHSYTFNTAHTAIAVCIGVFLFAAWWVFKRFPPK